MPFLPETITNAETVIQEIESTAIRMVTYYRRKIFHLPTFPVKFTEKNHTMGQLARSIKSAYNMVYLLILFYKPGSFSQNARLDPCMGLSYALRRELWLSLFFCC